MYLKLESQAQAYPCYCTPAELELSRKLQRMAGQPPRYAGTCRGLSPAQRTEREASGLKPSLRFAVPQGVLVEFTDAVHGPQRFASSDIGDFIIRREDGTPAFFFCNAVDDSAMGVTQAVRPERPAGAAGDRDRLSRSECGSDLASTETASAGVARSSAFASLRVPAFRWWFLAQIVSGSGNMAQGVGMAWLVLQLSGSSVDLGLVSVAMFAPVLLTGAWAGVLLDHVDHRRTLMATQIAGCALAFTLGLLTTTGVVQIWMIFALAAADGFVFAIDQPARQLYVIELVGRERVQSAVGLFEVIINASRVLGPAVGGVVIALFGVAACFYVNAATFVVPLLVLLWLRPRARPERAPRPNTLSAMREGFRFVRHSPAILACLGMAAASGMLFNLGVALPVLATRAFGLGSIGYGLLFASFGLGAIPGGLAAARSHGAPRGRQVRLLCLTTGIVVVATAYAPWTPLAYVLLALAGFFSIWFIALANTLVQLRPAPNMRGRVMGLWTMALPGLNPVTGLMVGAVAELAGPREGFALAGVTLAIAALAGWRALSD